jgi:hypothetical protein
MKVGTTTNSKLQNQSIDITDLQALVTPKKEDAISMKLPLQELKLLIAILLQNHVKSPLK